MSNQSNKKDTFLTEKEIINIIKRMENDDSKSSFNKQDKHDQDK